ncbi:MAG: c-type cytochrome [Chloroflexi bacterium]|nr:c-type cytochrome [Chloroflexota bacterium]
MIRLQITLGLVLILAASTVVLIIGVRDVATDHLTRVQDEQHARSVEVGAELFYINCSRCHGEDGKGTPGLCPPLNDRTFFETRLKDIGYAGTLRAYVNSVIAAGRPVSTRPQQYAGQMPTWSNVYGGPLRPDQIDNLTDFVLNWQATAMSGAQPAKPEPEKAASPEDLGKQVFQRAACVACHAIGNTGGAVGPNLTKVYEDAQKYIADPNYKGQAKAPEDYIRESIMTPNTFVVPGFQPNIMPQNFGQTLKQNEIDGLVAYLSTLK